MKQIKEKAKIFISGYRGPFYSINDSVRILLMLGILAFLFWSDPSMIRIVSYVLGIQVALSLISHLSRKLLFPKVELDLLLNKAREEPLSSAVALLAISIVLSVLIEVSARMFGGAS